jgi:hypothetical protein
MGNRAAIVLLVISGCAVGEVGPPRLADVSRVLYLNDCMPGGCLMEPGDDDARTNHSSIVARPTTIAAFSWGPEDNDVAFVFAAVLLDTLGGPGIIE